MTSAEVLDIPRPRAFLPLKREIPLSFEALLKCRRILKELPSIAAFAHGFEASANPILETGANVKPISKPTGF
jgi:hypothetical protein